VSEWCVGGIDGSEQAMRGFGGVFPRKNCILRCEVAETLVRPSGMREIREDD
jgi:hypothetical protein